MEASAASTPWSEAFRFAIRIKLVMADVADWADADQRAWPRRSLRGQRAGARRVHDLQDRQASLERSGISAPSSSDPQAKHLLHINAKLQSVIEGG
jgi:hypothetical protein